MELTSPKNIKELLKKHNATALKQLGQHFLVDRGVLRKIMEAANLNKTDTVLEIGPGIGTLTLELAKKAGKVIAIEKDKKMCEILKETLKDFTNVEIIQGDILKILYTRYKIQDTGYKVVSNLPYYITSPVIRKFLENTGVRPLEMILMVQKEVAQRICAKPPDMNLLAVSVQFYVHPPQVFASQKFGRAGPKIISYVSKKSFWPQPKVDSAIIKITPFAWAHSHIPSGARSTERGCAFRMLFFKIVKAGFSQPRKQLINNLSRLNFSSKNLSGQAKGLKLSKEEIKDWLLENKIQPIQRAETLSIENWISLTKTFKNL